MSHRQNSSRSPLLRRPTDFHHGPPSAASPARNVAPVSRAADQIAPVARRPATAPQSPIGRDFAQPRDDAPDPVQVTATATAISPPAAPPDVACGPAPAPAYWAAAAVIFTTLLLWLYGSTIGSLVAAWSTDPEAFHGILVVPVALLILWRRRELIPWVDEIPGWGGLVLVAAGLGMKIAAMRMQLPALAGWSLLFWLAGAGWVLAGRRTLVWALPAILFLSFAIPLPGQLAHLLSGPIQSVVTNTSAWLLVCIGRPAIAEGCTLFYGDQSVAVDAVCSGAGIFYGFAATIAAFSILLARSTAERLALFGTGVPLAIVAAAIRVAALAAAVQPATGDAAATGGSHYIWLTSLVAVMALGLLVFYLRKLIVEVELESGHRLLTALGEPAR